MDEWLFNGILFVYQKEGISAMYNNMDEPRGNFAVLKYISHRKTNTYDLTYMQNYTGESHSDRSRIEWW